MLSLHLCQALAAAIAISNVLSIPANPSQQSDTLIAGFNDGSSTKRRSGIIYPWSNIRRQTNSEYLSKIANFYEHARYRRRDLYDTVEDTVDYVMKRPEEDMHTRIGQQRSGFDEPSIYSHAANQKTIMQDAAHSSDNEISTSEKLRKKQGIQKFVQREEEKRTEEQLFKRWRGKAMGAMGRFPNHKSRSDRYYLGRRKKDGYNGYSSDEANEATYYGAWYPAENQSNSWNIDQRPRQNTYNDREWKRPIRPSLNKMSHGHRINTKRASPERQRERFYPWNG